MENKKLILFLTFYIIILSAYFVVPAHGFSDNNRNIFTFRFENCTVTDALRELSEKSGITIKINGVINKEIFTKSYINRSFDTIIADLLRGENRAVVWIIKNGDIDSIVLYTFEKDSTGGNISQSMAIMSPRTINDRNEFQRNLNRDEISNMRNSYLRNNEVNNSNEPVIDRPAPRPAVAARRIIPRRNITNNRNGRSENTPIDSNNEQGDTVEDKDPATEPHDLPTPEPVEPTDEIPQPEEGDNVLEPPPMPPGF